MRLVIFIASFIAMARFFYYSKQMSWHAIILSNAINWVPRSDLLFSYCGHCQRQLAWRPKGGQKFYSHCCRFTYEARPIALDLKMYEVVVKPTNMDNVRMIKKSDMPVVGR